MVGGGTSENRENSVRSLGKLDLEMNRTQGLVLSLSNSFHIWWEQQSIVPGEEKKTMDPMAAD